VIASTTIIENAKQPIHWEAVLITAVPATLAMIGSIVAAILGHYNGKHVRAIDTAVNGTEEGQPTIRESVEQTKQQVQSLTNDRAS
jgi:uncharacterized protein YcfJ